MRIMVFRIIGRRAAGIKRYVNAGRCGDDRWRTPPVRYFYSDSSDPTLLPSLCQIVGWRLRHPTMC